MLLRMVFTPELGGLVAWPDGWAVLPSLTGSMSSIAAYHRLPDLFAFHQVDEEAGEQEFDEELDGEPPAHPPEQWFDPSIGLAAVDRWLHHLRTQPVRWQEKWITVDELTRDLKEIEEALTAAAAAGVRFAFRTEW